MTSVTDPVTLQVLWNRLISLTDEAAHNLVRSSFSTVVRESNDFACVLMDVAGNSVAQSSLSIPSFLGTLPITTKHFLRKFPVETLKPGDVLITNDPWLATGHLPDITIVTPVFYRGRVVAFAGNTAHSPDIGGRMRSADSREIFEEGLRLPPSKLFNEGRRNEQLIEIIENNVRVPVQVIGDMMAQVATNDLMARRLVEILEEYNLDDFGPLARTIQERSEQALRACIRTIPDGNYQDQIAIDGFDEPLTIRCTVTVQGDEISVDYSGTSPQIERGLNTVLNYTYAYTVYPLKCVLDPFIPNNQGCFNPIRVTAPEGCLLNPRFPAPVGGRALVGHFLHAVVFGALAQAVPDRVQADSGSPLWMLSLSGEDNEGRRYATTFFLNGGQGASQGRDGLSCVSFPSNISNTPVEIIEATTPIRFLAKELRQDSGGAGQFRGGLGQRVAFEVVAEKPIRAAILTERVHHPARGIRGGGNGAVGAVLLNGEPIHPKKQRILRKGDVLEMRTPGGGGFGNPHLRDREKVRLEMESGLLSGSEAALTYGL